MFVVGMLNVLESLAPLVAKLGDEPLESDEAVDLVDLGIELERLGAAVRMIAARSVDSDRWKAAGFRSAAAWMAARAGLPVGPAISAMETLRLLDDLPATAAAFREGRLSLAQVSEIAEVASEWPATEQRLLDAAEVTSLAELREECRRVKAAAIVDEDEWYRRLRKGRCLRSWTDRDGAVRISARLTPDEGGRLLAGVDHRCAEMEGDARAGGWYEGHDAHRADALVDLARTAAGGGGPAAPEATVHVFVDYDALVRGHTLEEEHCEIPGVGPIPVSVARRMATDSILKVIVTKGVEITAVAHAGRTIRAHHRSALEARDPVCIVPGCGVRRGLQIDHRGPYVETRHTSLDGTARLCRWHHYQKSHCGYTYRGGPGAWEWIPPDLATEPPLPDRGP
jgi:Domain of unknown function (DUF222)